MVKAIPAERLAAEERSKLEEKIELVETKKIIDEFSQKAERKRILLRENPFTWILTANCSEKTLIGASAVPDKSF
jgi:hypothetical protein